MRVATSAEDKQAIVQLRALAFRDPAADPFDAACLQVLVEDQRDGALVCCFRLLHLHGASALEQSYSAQFYDLSRLSGFAGPLLELGRFCVDPARQDPDILRAAWGAMTAYVDAHQIEMLFGCASFRGTDPRPYHDAFSLLRHRHLAPDQWRPGIKAPSVFPFAQEVVHKPDLKAAQTAMPPLLRTYLVMGGWVSDHAVIDVRMDTLHVFTGLEIRAVPPARARLLRAVAK